MANQQIVEYLKGAEHSGISFAEAKAKLISVGWNTEEIDAAIKYLVSQGSAQISQPPLPPASNLNSNKSDNNHGKFWNLETTLFLCISALLIGAVLFLSTLTISNLSQSKAVDTKPIDDFMSKFVNTTSWQKTLSGQGNEYYKFRYIVNNKDNWSLSFAHNLRENYIGMRLDWAFANKESFPKESQFNPNSNYDRGALEQFYRSMGVVDEIFFSKIREDFNEEYHPGNYLGEPPQFADQLDVRGNWSFTPSLENKGLTKITFWASSIGHFPGQDSDVSTFIDWEFDPNFVPSEVNQTIAKIETEGVQKGLATEGTIQSVKFLSSFTLLAPYYYLTLPLTEFPRGVMSNFHGGQEFLMQVFIFQLVLSIIHLIFAFFLLKFILRRRKNLRFGIFWILMAVLVVLVFYMATEFYLVRYVLSDH